MKTLKELFKDYDKNNRNRMNKIRKIIKKL